MDDKTLDDVVAVLPPLLQALDRLGFVSRYLHPAHFAQVLDAVGEPEAELAAARHRLENWPAELADVQAALATASDSAITAFAALRAASEAEDGLMASFRALRELPKALEAIYPLAEGLPPVSRFFLDPAHRDDADLVQRLAESPGRADTGVMHFENEPGSRGGFSVYVPETYDPARRWPIVFALHGGSGNGRSFLWSWVREARTFGAIVVAPTAVGRTWAIQGPDPDTPNLARMLAGVQRQWNVDEERILLSGMSDGGTFAYVSGLELGSPFTHLAPTSAAFHPMLAGHAERDRIHELPIHITHGTLDWMFPIDMAREAAQALTAAGASVTYRELDDLSHTYPRELNGPILRWMDET